MSAEMDTIEHLSDLLASGDIMGIKSLMKEENFEIALQDKGNDLIPIACYYINKEAMLNSPAIFRCAVKIIDRCAEQGHPRECLMEYLAQIESLDKVKFQTMLKPIQTTLLRIPERKAPMMQWVFSGVYTFLNSLPLPQNYHVQEREKALLDCDENFPLLRGTYELLMMFYEPFVDEITNTLNIDNKTKNLKLAVLQSLFHLLGYPLVFLDLEYNEKGSSPLRDVALKIVQFVIRLQRNPLQFLQLIEDKELINVKEEKTLMKEFSSNEIKFSDLSLAVFFYLIFSEKMSKLVPCVYNKLFTFQNCLISATTLLQYEEVLVLRKGLLLVKAVLEQVEDGSVPFACLTENVHKQLIKLLSNIAVYHEVEENRKLAVGLIKDHFSKFATKAQFYILLNCSSVVQHPHMVGFFTTMLTNLLQKNINTNEFKDYFTGKRLFDLLKIFCSLKKGVETDLMENKNQILSALNLVIFLTRRDRENTTGVWNYTDRLSQSFLTPLREAIDLSRAHCQLELKTLDDPVKGRDRAELAISVGGQQLADMSTEDKKHVINSCLTGFDLIEHLLSRANECLEERPGVKKRNLP